MELLNKKLQIFVKPYFRTLTLVVRPSHTVAIVKRMIETKLSGEEAIPFFKMTLAYAGKLLDDERILSDYCIANHATLTYGINMSAEEPPSDMEAPQVLRVRYPAERKRFSSDCLYEVRPADTVGDLKRYVLERQGIVCTRVCDCDASDETSIADILGSLLYSKWTLPTLHVPHFSRRARASRTVTRLATDLLREVLSYSDLRMLAASASTCRALREAVPPKLAHELVLARFPILTTIVDASKPMPPARELFESQARLFDAETPDVSPTHSLDEYVFSLELTVGSSKHVGTGVALENSEGHAQISFTGIPKALWDADDHGDTRANVMATRRGTLRRAALYSGEVEDGDGTTLYFDWTRIPSKDPMAEWINTAIAHHNICYKPMFQLEWNGPAAENWKGELTARFRWDSDDSVEDMSLEDACLTLEHWCKL